MLRFVAVPCGRAGCIPLHRQQCGRAECASFLQLAVWTCRVSIVEQLFMSDCPASDQSDTGMEKMPMPEAARYRNNGIKVRYRTEKPKFGMPKLAASCPYQPTCLSHSKKKRMQLLSSSLSPSLLTGGTQELLVHCPPPPPTGRQVKGMYSM